MSSANELKTVRIRQALAAAHDLAVDYLPINDRECEAQAQILAAVERGDITATVGAMRHARRYGTLSWRTRQDRWAGLVERHIGINRAEVA